MKNVYIYLNQFFKKKDGEAAIMRVSLVVSQKKQSNS